VGRAIAKEGSALHAAPILVPSHPSLASLKAGCGARSDSFGPPLAAPQGAPRTSMIGEPQTLDPMASTADLVSISCSITSRHVRRNWNVAPMLASVPTISKDGLVTIPLRKASSSITARK
jgi:peptide/nickel transport system substrate-binding protein